MAVWWVCLCSWLWPRAVCMTWLRIKTVTDLIIIAGRDEIQERAMLQCITQAASTWELANIFSSSFYLKSGFHYPSWRPKLTARVDGRPVSSTRQVNTGRVDGRAFPLAELTGRQHCCCCCCCCCCCLHSYNCSKSVNPGPVSNHLGGNKLVRLMTLIKNNL